MNGDPVHSSKSTYHSALRARRRRATWWLAALIGALATSLAVPAIGGAATAPVPTPAPAAPAPPPPASNPNDYTCAGQIGPGKAEDGGEETPVQYEFSCNGQITGYQLQTQLPVTGIEGSPLVTNYAGTPLKEAFSCGGAFPGYAVNCVGATTAEPNEHITGQFTIGWKLCTEPRVDPLLTVTYAYLEKGAIVQAISGPFDLGRPNGCPATALSGKTRLDAYQGPEPKKSKKSKKGGRHGKHGRGRGHGGTKGAKHSGR